ncbi:beta-ketoacyl synthase domain-containing protein [Colletotrichum orchidophilum]|uniref:Beta-ketoacyl synthase domain-containing protein n=1 Tax=Colletotrichum orchidophilum TaxID=1209926 RepID=A0A1G4BTH7_9PEZI|nr:beta-ketoacyl synthase domain-containing protein [Colletotrichum orchidophilum]OHF04557.1 beta-ketoacyl synthase domain-containing protein [Colletotrichum orchidophilum]
MPFNNAATEFRVALFGPQRTAWTRRDVEDLQSAFREDARLEFLRKTLGTLPSLWPQVQQAYGSPDFPAAAKLQRLQEIVAGSSSIDDTVLSNTELAPLTVITQVVDLIQQHGTSLENFEAAQGFCVGFLSAASYSSARDWQHFEGNVSNAVRLAACFGIAVDIEQTSSPVKVVSVRCRTPAERATLDTCLDRFPNAYISCVTEDRNLTITLPHASEADFSSLLRKADIATTAIDLQGSYHHLKHSETSKTLISLYAQHENLRLPEATELRLPLRSTADAELITTGALHDIATQLILGQRANWFETVKKTVAHLSPDQTAIVSFGSELCLPRSLARCKQQMRPRKPTETEEIAVVGMSCRFPQSESLGAFWRLVEGGGTCIDSMPTDRFDPARLQREPVLDTFWGNFIDRPDVFDHKFFGISGREAKSMDPQQRLALQVAYEAMSSSGYCSKPSAKRVKDVGCYLGVGAVDYEENVASHAANAFAATGILRAFISGRISHHFGWEGPSLTVDTACSSSAVAIHTACKALLGGECSMALAGGVNIITSPSLHQNLAGASFLNPKGSSRAFDADAGGYCRGEGAGMVVLKRLSTALADGDVVIGVIASSAVNQNSSCSPITVPHSDSQSTLYKRVLNDAGIQAQDVTYVEAHGTGTQVGDPIEYESIRSALTGPLRTEQLYVGSVKDNIGHAEAASGAAGVIKCLLMMHYKTIPKQASFTSINPKIRTSAGDRITVSTKTVPWTSSKHIAMVNNYGAAGSNAAILIRAHPVERRRAAIITPAVHPSLFPHPILLSAKTATSLTSYAEALKTYLSKGTASLGDISYNIARAHDVSLKCRVGFVSDAIDSTISSLSGTKAFDAIKSPIVLCFGGQTGQTVTVSKELYNSSDLFQKHLDECDSVCRRLGYPSLFPGIFEPEEIEDSVLLHCRLLSLQLSCARSWIDSGLEVDTLLGHSFGQLTALCVADSISLEDTFRLVVGRARLVRDAWGPDHGAMLAVECTRADLDHIISQVNSGDGLRVEVACYNGPQQFVLAGDTLSIAKAAELCRSFKVHELGNTHAYHSHLTDAILKDLLKIAGSVKVQPPRIPIETCTLHEAWTNFTPEAIVNHTRQPVYLNEAVNRIASRFPRAIWVESGSATPILAMAKRAINATNRSDVFLPMQLGAANAMRNLAKAACELWKAGSAAQYWLHHPSSGYRYQKVNVPPYQFEQTSHWLLLEQRLSPATIETTRAPRLVKLVKHDRANGELISEVNTSSDTFQLAASGHAVAGQHLCPASMYMEIVAQSASLDAHRTSSKQKRVPHVECLTMLAPLGTSDRTVVRVHLHQTAPESWKFVISSQATTSSRPVDVPTRHATGSFSWQQADDAMAERRLRVLGRLGTSQTSASAMATGMSGVMVYDMFSNVVDYADYYRGVHSISASDNVATATVKVPAKQHGLIDAGITDPIMLDNFLQVAGIHTNCLSPRDQRFVLMCTSIDEIIFTPYCVDKRSADREWIVHTRFDENTPANTRTNDIFVCEAATGQIVMAVLGANFKGVPLKSLAKSLTRLNKSSAVEVEEQPVVTVDSGYESERSDPEWAPAQKITLGTVEATQLDPLAVTVGTAEPNDALSKLRTMLSEIIEIAVDEVLPTSSLDALGIDSLLITEVLAEIKTRFGIVVAQEKLANCADVRGVADLLSGGEPQRRDKMPRASTSEVSRASNSASSLHDSHVVPSSTGFTDKEVPGSTPLAVAGRHIFSETIVSYDRHAEDTGFTDFYADVFPTQSALVVQYVLTAFVSLGCDLTSVAPGATLPPMEALPKHAKVIVQLHEILATAGLLSKRADGEFIRTQLPVPTVPASVLKDELLQKFPKHTSETMLLHSTGQQLADCLTGRVDPVSVLFGNAAARELLGDVYTNAPMFKTGTLVLSQYLSSLLRDMGGKRELRILELGAGTGGTTKNVVETLVGLGHNFIYTFTDLSSSLVAAAKRKFSKWSFMEYQVVDIEKDTRPDFVGKYDIILSTNCIHATRDLVNSTSHIHEMLKPDGLLCLVELTQNLYWFDLVFGLLEGWWLSSDGRWHALASEELWKKDLLAAGFKWVDWSRSSTKESQLLRVITASPFDAPLRLETVQFKEVDGQKLYADIHYPDELVEPGKTLPVALMIHGGGHIMLSRHDVRADQTAMLLDAGFLPISIDYRLCPETTLSEGPMTDVVDGLHWIRTTLPHVALSRSDISVDASKVVVIGWSTGGHLATTLAWTSKARGVQPPEAIFALYCPLDYEDPFWMRPNIPEGAGLPEAATGASFELDEHLWTKGVFDAPITKYNVAPSKKALGGWLAPSDPRSRLALYMNCSGRTLHVLLAGLDKKMRREPAAPAQADIVAVSPLAQVRAGNYTTPTFILHPRGDDLIPWQQAQRTWEALQEIHVNAELRIVEGVGHLFDLGGLQRVPTAVARQAVVDGYDFLCRHVGLQLRT